MPLTVPGTGSGSGPKAAAAAGPGGTTVPSSGVAARQASRTAASAETAVASPSSPGPAGTPSGQTGIPTAPPAGGSASATTQVLAGGTSSGAGTTTTTPTTRGYRVVASVVDPAGDAGLLVAPYADLVRITVEHDGTNARVTVETAGTLPSRLPGSEVAGIGVDFFLGDRADSEHQLFVDGSPDGWFAYLYVRGALIEFPGTFAVGGSRLLFDLPWADLGGTGVTRLSAFYDWSQDALPDNRVGEDHAPQLGTSTVQH